MDAPCKIQGSIHVFRLVNNMCPGKWVHIKVFKGFLVFKIKFIKNLYDYGMISVKIIDEYKMK